MKVLYHLPVLPPKLPQAEALSQEIAALQAAFGGQLNYVNPNGRFPRYAPRLLFGLHQLQRLWRQETAVDLHHFYNPDPFPYPFLRLLKKPVVYSLSSGLGATQAVNTNYFGSMTAVTVYDARSQARLHQLGLNNVHLVRSGIDVSRFTPAPLPLANPLRLLVASAPWTAAQFAHKGIDVLLQTAVADPTLHLTFLWRGEQTAVMRQRIANYGLQEQVTLIDKLVDVDEMLATVHATVNLATHSGVIKAYPHSLLDSLAAGKPVLVSRTIAMADDVARLHCGVVVDEVTVAGVQTAVFHLRQHYETLAERATAVGQTEFTQAAMVQSFGNVYHSALGY